MPLIADVTDTPVWFLFGATVTLAIVTAAVAGAAIYALRQLAEIRVDREVSVLGDLGRRWDDRPVSEALERAAKYDKDELAEVVRRAHKKRSKNRLKDWPRARADKELVILLRVPNFFEDLAVIAEEGGLDPKLVSRIFKGLALREWTFWEPAMVRLREQDKYSYTQWESLVQLMKELPDE
jgi:hypothetical protein